MSYTQHLLVLKEKWSKTAFLICCSLIVCWLIDIHSCILASLFLSHPYPYTSTPQSYAFQSTSFLLFSFFFQFFHCFHRLQSTDPLSLPSLPEDVGDVRVQTEDPDQQWCRDQDKRPGHTLNCQTQPCHHGTDQSHTSPCPLQLLFLLQ